MLKQKKQILGVSLTELMIAVSVLLFVSYSALMLLGSSSLKSNLLSKRNHLASELDDRVKIYKLTSSFTQETVGNNTFSKEDITNEGNNGQGVGNSTTEGNQSGGDTGNSTGVDYSMYRFTVTDDEDGLIIHQLAFERV